MEIGVEVTESEHEMLTTVGMALKVSGDARIFLAAQAKPHVSNARHG